MRITKTSEFSGKISSREINITEQQYIDYCNGKLGFAQDAFPHLSAEDREFLISGGTPEEWEEVFGSDFDDKDGTIDVDTEHDAPPM